MLLKNFGAYCAVAFTDDKLTEGIKCTTGEFPVNNGLKTLPPQLGVLFQIVSSITYNANTSGGSNSNWAFIFGDGTTPPTIEDYKLSGNIVEPTALGSGSASNGSNGSTWQMIVINNTKTPMTINEIGLCNELPSFGCVMLTRDVLPEPVVLQPGASKGFQVFIDTQSFVANASQV